jgi:hypothetical protein
MAEAPLEHFLSSIQKLTFSSFEEIIVLKDKLRDEYFYPLRMESRTVEAHNEKVYMRPIVSLIHMPTFFFNIKVPL